MAIEGLYTKNVPSWERVLRILVALSGVVVGFTALPAPWSFLVAGSSVGFALTGLFGYCPACAMMGRKL